MVELDGRWRVFFDWKGALPPDNTPVDLQATLRYGDRQIAETWLYAYYPEALPRQHAPGAKLLPGDFALGPAVATAEEALRMETPCIRQSPPKASARSV